MKRFRRTFLYFTLDSFVLFLTFFFVAFILIDFWDQAGVYSMMFIANTEADSWKFDTV